MSHFAIKVDLSKLKHVIREIKLPDGRMQQVVILDVATNHLFIGKEGAIYLDLVAFENKEVKYDNTHSLKQSLSKSVREGMTDEQIKSMPFFGNMKPIGGNSSGAQQSQQNNQQAAQSGDPYGIPDFGNSGPVNTPAKDPLDDLPF